jgi:glycosyltransferase involved in cell wall biosynthesis
MATVGLNAHLVSTQQTYRAGGISRASANLIDALARIDVPERFVVFREGRLPTHRPAVRILWEQLVAPFEARRLDLFHGLAYALPLVLPCAGVVTVHDLSFMRYPELFNRPNRLYLKVATRIATRQARRVIAVSESTKRELVTLLGAPADKIVAIPNGVEPSFRPLPREEVETFRRAKGLPDRFILCLATLEPRKNLGLLVRAFARMNTDHALVLAGGKGWLYDAIFAEVRSLGLESRVLFPGFIPFEEQPLWYNAAAALAYPSLYEGFGLPPLESMACGTPVVCANSSSLPEVVGDAGLLVDPRDDAGLAEALGRLTEDAPLRERLREAGLSRARLFSWDDVARRTVDVYRAALA